MLSDTKKVAEDISSNALTNFVLLRDLPAELQNKVFEVYKHKFAS